MEKGKGNSKNKKTLCLCLKSFCKWRSDYLELKQVEKILQSNNDVSSLNKYFYPSFKDLFCKNMCDDKSTLRFNFNNSVYGYLFENKIINKKVKRRYEKIDIIKEREENFINDKLYQDGGHKIAKAIGWKNKSRWDWIRYEKRTGI